jgi:hypothetical protein
VGCGDGFYTIPLARFLGPSGRVYADDIGDGPLAKLKQHLAEEGLKKSRSSKMPWTTRNYLRRCWTAV